MMTALLHDPKSGKHHFGIQARCVRHGDHGNACTVGTVKQLHEARQRPNLPRSELAESFFFLCHDYGLALRRLPRQKPFADRSIGKTEKFLRGALAIEHVAARAKDLIERFQMERICVRQRAVNVEQQRLPKSRHDNCYPDGIPWRQLPPAILAAAITACVRLSTPSFCRIAETCALMVASDTPSS